MARPVPPPIPIPQDLAAAEVARVSLERAEREMLRAVGELSISILLLPGLKVGDEVAVAGRGFRVQCARDGDKYIVDNRAAMPGSAGDSDPFGPTWERAYGLRGRDHHAGPEEMDIFVRDYPAVHAAFVALVRPRVQQREARGEAQMAALSSVADRARRAATAVDRGL